MALDRDKWDRACSNTKEENLHRKCGRNIFFFVHETVDGSFQLGNVTELFINPPTEKYFVQECDKGKTLRRSMNPRDARIRNSEF